MKIQEFFRHFIRIHYKGIEISNEDLDGLALEFEAYLFEKVGEEKGRSWYPESLPKLLLNQGHPLKMNGYEPPLVLWFTEFVKEGAEKFGIMQEQEKKPELPPKKDANGKLLKLGDKVHPVGRGADIRYIVELGDRVAGISSDRTAKTGIGVNYNKLVKMKDQS